MRDPILDQGNAYLAALRTAYDAAQHAAEGLADAEPIVSGLADWCRGVVFKPVWMETRDERGGLSDLLTLPPSQSPLQVLECVPDATRRESLGEAFSRLMEGREGDRSNVAAWFLGRALAKGLIAELPKVKARAGPLIAEVRNLIGSQDIVHSAFEESLREGLHDSPTARFAIRSALDSWISEINANPGIGTLSLDRDSFCTLVDEWRKDPSIRALWKAREAPFPVHYDVLEFIPNILPTDRASLLERLDGFRFPEPIRQVLQHPAILHDRDEFAAALTDAPPCSDDGAVWNRSLLAPLVLKTAESHCRALWEAAYPAAEPDNGAAKAADHIRVTLSSWFEELGRIVMARPDGRFLGSQWLLMKVSDERLDRARHRRAGNQLDHLLRDVDLIEWIARGLFGAGLTNDQIAPFVDVPDISAPGDLAPPLPASRSDDSVPPRLAALTVMCLSGQLTSEVSAGEERNLLDALDALLATRDSGFESESPLEIGGHGVPASCFGRLLAGEERPAERWRQSWGRLVEQRRRVQHWQQTRDGDALAPSAFLLAVGLAGIDWLLSPSDSRRDEAGRLWREVFDGARDCWLTISVRHLKEPIETCIGRLFARHPKVFCDAPGDAYASDRKLADRNEFYADLLSRDLDLLGGDDLTLAVCCLNVGDNGASPGDLDDVLRRNSGHLDAILRQFERWQRLEREVRRRPEIVEALARFRKETAGGVNERRSDG